MVKVQFQIEVVPLGDGAMLLACSLAGGFIDGADEVLDRQWVIGPLSPGQVMDTVRPLQEAIHQLMWAQAEPGEEA